ncbi:hypothetical protein [Candidatus Mesenet endosymbiont of Phosphuga atrata]
MSLEDELCDAVEAGDESKVESLLFFGVYINAINKEGLYILLLYMKIIIL